MSQDYKRWTPRRIERATLPYVCHACGTEGHVAWSDFSHAYISFIETENARLREALEDLERVSGHAMMSDDPARVSARAALEESK